MVSSVPTTALGKGMSKCVVYVGGLSEAASDGQLRDLLGAYGTVVHVCIVRHKRSEKSAGYGFVRLSSTEEALRAVAALDGSQLGDNRLRLYITRGLER